MAQAIPAIALAVSAGAAVATTAYTIKSGEDAKARAEEQAAAQKKQQDQLLADQKKQQEDAQKQEAQTAAVAQADSQLRATRQRKAGYGTGRSGTILTGPLGLGSGGSAGGAPPKKTILGA